MISAKLGHFFDRPLASLAKRIDVNPNIITVTGFLITTIAAITIPERPFVGGALILLGGFFDMLDGVIARVNMKTTNFGAFLDSVLDRYSDSFLLLGFSVYFYRTGILSGVFLCFGTLIGALIISYAKARAQGLGEDCETGLMERPERVLLMAFAAITGWILPVMWAMLILTHVTVIQRIYHVYRLMSSKA
jgi:phosphatidylglycerophosphate synthase